MENNFYQVLPGHLRKASIIHEETKVARKREAEKTWKYIEDKINFASSHGNYEVEFEGQIDKHTIKVLKELGYKIKIYYAEIDDYGYYYPSTVRISWKKVKKN